MSMIEDILQQMQGAPTQQVANQLGVDPSQAQQAIASALPMLVGALGQQVQDPSGAQMLAGALERDHSNDLLGGGLGGLLGSVLGGLGGGQPVNRQTDGGGILGHIFGGQQQQAAMQLGQANGLGDQRTQMLLKILAPIAMAYLAKRMFAHPDTNNANSVAQVLGQEQQHVQSGGGMLGQLFGGGDGRVDIGDILRMGSSVLGGRGIG